MLSAAKVVKFGAAAVIAAVFGLLTVSGATVGLRAARPELVPDDVAAATFGGQAACGSVGGVNCDDSTHTCSTTGCTATSTTCTWTWTQCIMLQTLSTPSSFPCAKHKTSGNCCAAASAQCIVEAYGPGASWYSCNYGSFYCSSTSMCGEALYHQYPCRP
jgi:hypothetical protein